ncbi:MAG TPA: tRNA (N(6)-L-threonylcarbamoyladenosine(37)-C(2))-methylthiotransferase [Nanoarchaeota archaeon]|nr:tRNA (N(6)-L-threonylcarbamoyladenosine(37)-C(2))-methylthiotransferase [Nanoarchaeota archaeon]
MKVLIKTWGCAASQSDSEIMAGLLARAGHELVKDETSADVIIANTCTVKHRVEIDELKEIEKLKQKGKKIIATGCLVQDKQHLNKLNGISYIGLNSEGEIAKYVDEVARGEVVQVFSDKKLDRAALPRIRKNPVVETIQILQGCMSNCTFCATKLAKGNTYSFSEARILAQAESAVRDGCKEIWLTSQDNGTYGIDRGTNIANLLGKICAIHGKFFVRNGMANPQWIKMFQKELIAAYKNEKVFKFLHIPVQSGSDRVLKDMRRGHSAKDFKKIVEAFREVFPKITIATDIICGFPSETEKDFEKTLKLIKETKPDMINISQFWPRPGTNAAEMKQLRGDVKKARSRQLTKLCDEITMEQNKKWIGWQGQALVDEKNDDGTFVARNASYKPILLKAEGLKLGDIRNVKIISAKEKYLIGIVQLLLE